MRAISDLRRAESFAARALPPFSPPSLPRATAAGFFFSRFMLLERLGMRYYEITISNNQLVIAVCVSQVHWSDYL